ncbi:salivary protein KUN-5, putative [Ixodes scapularis]|uniref:Salivary protein KUN-5, putative n=1 Tax=Ixodes scapularis TaxID=6945 RepID=B7QMX5_IXOSC|nr:salivary protein KUN-5, putative [Ixodes scapularis]|eukprot:XP_002400363.1 salivary protein KUN-5, putative [Ixodes scapularis]
MPAKWGCVPAGHIITTRGCFAVTFNKSCSLDWDSGPCYAKLPRFFYKKDQKICTMFVYGGCEGNKNRFRTKAECEQQCIKGFTARAPMCDLGPVVEQCASKSKTHRRRYYYDDKLDDCHPFTYRGCRVKKAHFHTLDACKNTCKKKNI